MSPYRHRQLDFTTYRLALAQAGDPPPPGGAAQLARSLRRMNAIASACDASEDEVAWATAQLEAIVERLEPSARASRYGSDDRPEADALLFVHHPLIGALHPSAPPIAMRPDGERLRGYATYGPAFEGPQGYVHGGHIAAGFDAIVVMTAGANGRGGVTRSLSIRFRRPAPLAQELCYEGDVESVAEGSTIVRAVLRHGDQVCAECTGDVATGRRPTGVT